MMPPPEAGGRDVLATDAYEMFWDCLENDVSVGEDVSRPDDPGDAYHQFWQQADG
jgi:hypothetical protein